MEYIYLKHCLYKMLHAWAWDFGQADPYVPLDFLYQYYCVNTPTPLLFQLYPSRERVYLRSVCNLCKIQIIPRNCSFSSYLWYSNINLYWQVVFLARILFRKFLVLTETYSKYSPYLYNIVMRVNVVHFFTTLLRA